MIKKKLRPSRSAWAIVGREGRLRLEQRGLDNHPEHDGLFSVGGASASYASERVLQTERVLKDRIIVGPFYNRKADALELCWPGERVVKARIVARQGQEKA